MTNTYYNMLITQDSSPAAYQVSAFTDSSITINEMVYYESLIVSSNTFISDWGPQSVHTLTQQHCEKILPLQPEILLLGTGKIFRPLPPELINFFNIHKINIEIMNTSAACRTYLALLTDNRHVAAALIIDHYSAPTRNPQL